MSRIDRQTVIYRPITEDDRPFLTALYASTRADEMQQVPWTDEQKAEFLAMQFHAQSVYYAEHYNTDDFFVIEQEGRPIGRLYLDHQPTDVCIVDIALIPELRGGGLGTVLLQEILDDAASKGKTVSIHVEYFNPAKRLYDRFGFQEKGTNGVYFEMIWTPPAK